MKIYLIPGLGYDHRIFERLTFKDYDVKYINWIEPKKNELIQAYAKRLFIDLPSNDEGIILIGHSLGGILAQEIALEKKIEKIILISSVRTRSEIPAYFKIVKPLMLYKLFTKSVCIKTVKYWGASHGFTEKDDIELFKSMVGNQSDNYLQWALKTLSAWKSSPILKRTSIFQIHGSEDKTFPNQLIKKANVIIEKGSHIMLYKKAKILSEHIIKAIEKS